MGGLDFFLCGGGDELGSVGQQGTKVNLLNDRNKSCLSQAVVVFCFYKYCGVNCVNC